MGMSIPCAVQFCELSNVDVEPLYGPPLTPPPPLQAHTTHKNTIFELLSTSRFFCWFQKLEKTFLFIYLFIYLKMRLWRRPTVHYR
jgi:hypothetical protein